MCLLAVCPHRAGVQPPAQMEPDLGASAEDERTSFASNEPTNVRLIGFALKACRVVELGVGIFYWSLDAFTTVGWIYLLLLGRGKKARILTRIIYFYWDVPAGSRY